MQSDLDEFRRELLAHLRQSAPGKHKDESDTLYSVNMFVVGLVELGVFSSTKKLSETVGHEDLQKTYRLLREESGDDNISRRLIDLAIRLDHLARIPVHDVEDLKSKVSKNIIAYTTLRLLIAEFLSLFPCDFKIKQKMEALLEFQPSTAARLAEKRVKSLPASSS